MTGTESPEVAYRWLVHGRVQGVSFRYYTLQKARELKLCGRVRNLIDGNVEIFVRGEPSQIRLLQAAVERGPAHSRVVRVETSVWNGPAGWTDFQIERT